MVDRQSDRSHVIAACTAEASSLRHPPGISDHRAQSLSNNVYSLRPASFTNGMTQSGAAPALSSMLYTAEERRRRDESPWTLVQGVLAPVQFVIFLVSLALVLRYLATGEGFAAATISVVVKTLALYAIMITGSIWEKVVFGRYLFARAFFWEDVFSMLVLALHTAYLAALAFGIGDARAQMWLALVAYATYVINATQFLLKLRAARLEAPRTVSVGATS
jgi:3-vinyl bacteriochlorophyllide hydratase